MIVSINQPAYLPWLGYFDRIKHSDLHIVLDHVQLEKGGSTNRTRIKQRDGRVHWLTVPVEKGKPINETKIANDNRWVGKHIDSLIQTYAGPGRGWRKYWSDVGAPITFGYELLNDLLTDHRNRFLRDAFRCKTKILVSSEMNVPGSKSDLILNLCKEVGATQYLSGPNGRGYLDLSSFEEAEIEVVYHDFPVEQPVLSAVDHLFGDL